MGSTAASTCLESAHTAPFPLIHLLTVAPPTLEGGVWGMCVLHALFWPPRARHLKKWNCLFRGLAFVKNSDPATYLPSPGRVACYPRTQEKLKRGIPKLCKRNESSACMALQSRDHGVILTLKYDVLEKSVEFYSSTLFIPSPFMCL